MTVREADIPLPSHTLLHSRACRDHGAPEAHKRTTSKLKDFALGTFRLGYAAGNWLFYGKAGVAWGQFNGSSIATNPNGSLFETATFGGNSAGGVIGIGTEWGFAPGWSARVEYDHIFFDSRNVLINGTVNLTKTSSGSNVDLVRAGVNYRFTDPLISKPEGQSPELVRGFSNCILLIFFSAATDSLKRFKTSSNRSFQHDGQHVYGIADQILSPDRLPALLVRFNGHHRSTDGWVFRRRST
jgi:Outer membrane protein beta-barrel domain